MINTLNRNIVLLVGLIVLLILLSFYDLTIGAIEINFDDFWNAIFNYDATNSGELSAHVFRIPKLITAICAGIALSVSGLLMQTLFQNPLAGPYVLGINSGASLMVALSTMTGFTVFTTDLGTLSSALIGAFTFGMIILFTSIYVKSKISLLLVGIMFGSFSGALINVIQSYSNPDTLKAFTLWSFGSLSNVQYEQIWWLTSVIFIGLVLSILLTKSLNLLVIGEQNASFLGVKIKRTRTLIIFITAILTGTITALCGPIAFVGLAIPNITKMIFKTSNHLNLLIGSALLGAILLIGCDILIQLLSNSIALPLNAITALVGAPIVIWIIIRKF